MYKQIEHSLELYGLKILHFFEANSKDSLPEIIANPNEYTLLLIGNVGSSIWPAFIQSAEYQDNLPNPMDRWSKRVATDLCQQYRGYAVFPFDGPPHYPFVSWANKSNFSSKSALGMSIHAVYGLWHAYRFALVMPTSKLKLPERESMPNPCLDCSQPCLSACPVTAFTGTDYQYLNCANHLSMNSDCDCNSIGCLSRRACPVATNYQYIPDHAQFHMRAFASSH